MAQQTINVGAAPNDGTGTPLRTAFQYTNSNFTELYTALGGGSGLPGASTQVIFNDGGTNLAGSAGLVFNKTTSVLGVGTVNAGAAIVSGDLTVDTSTLKVDSANDRVGIGIATPALPLDIRSATAVAQILSTTGTNAAYLQVSNTGGIFYLGRENSAGTSFASPAYSAVLYAGGAYPLVTTVNGSERYRIASDGVATWSNVGGGAGPAMTLNATGLGVGGSPTAKISCAGYSSANQLPDINIARSSSGTTIQTGPNIVFTDGTSNNTVTLQNSQGRFGVWNYGAGSWNERLIVDSSGNVGIGVTPSAWSGGRAVDLQLYGNLNTWDDGTAAQIQAGFNFYQTGSTFKYKISSRASMYRQRLGVHSWHYDTGTQTANADCAFTQAMTLDASGNLLVGTPSGTFRGTFVVAGGANRDILAAGVTAVSDGFQVKWNHATTKINVIISNMPTSSAGLAAGTLWNDAGTIKIA